MQVQAPREPQPRYLFKNTHVNPHIIEEYSLFGPYTIFITQIEEVAAVYRP